jgi:hypothetical protein
LPSIEALLRIERALKLGDNTMAKDPAFLFYPGDWLGGTLSFTRELKGAYMDLLMAQFNQGHLSLDDIQCVLGGDFDKLWQVKLQKKFDQDKSGLFYNVRLEEEQTKRRLYTQSRRDSRVKTDEDNVRVYLLVDHDSGYIKIGSSTNPLRRYNEIANQTVSCVGSSENRNYELMWHSEPTLRINEKKLHKMFESKRISGEWFELSDEDIEIIKRMY